MNTEHYKQLLTAKKLDLQADLNRSESEARDATVAEVGDEVDRITSSQGKSDQFTISSMDYTTLTLVDEALGRIADGTYGQCTACGEDIEPARLEAVPWAAYCIADQEKLEKAEGIDAPPTL